MMEIRRLRRFRTTAIVIGAVALMTLSTALTATTAAAAESDVAPPGPVRDLTPSPVGGGGNRGLAFDASWTPPEDQGGGIRTHYVVEVHDDLGSRLHSGATGSTSVEGIVGDYCRAPFTVSVHAVTQHPQTGEPLAGPPVEAQFGSLNLCEITMSITARQTGPGTVEVVRHREPPVDPSVAGPCELALQRGGPLVRHVRRLRGPDGDGRGPRAG
jgi:hypothetical protein